MPDRKSGEPLTDHSSRLEEASGTPKLRVFQEQTDGQGNVVLAEVVVTALDSNGEVHRIVDTEGFLKNKLAGSIVEISGTFTKTVGAGTGLVSYSVAAGDILWMMYGNISAGGIRNAAGTVNIDISTAGGAVITRIANEIGVDASESFVLPALGSGVPVVGGSAASNDFRQMGINEGERFEIENGVLQIDETFTFNFRFWSLTGTAPIPSATGGLIT